LLSGEDVSKIPVEPILTHLQKWKFEGEKLFASNLDVYIFLYNTIEYCKGDKTKFTHSLKKKSKLTSRIFDLVGSDFFSKMYI